MVARLTLGIDPGTAITGYGLVAEGGDRLVLVECGVLTTSPAQPLPQRLKELHDSLTALIVRQRPTEMAVEQLFLGRNARAAAAVYQARGVILVVGADHGLLVSEYTPLQVKRAVARYGRAAKEQVQDMVRILLNLATVPQPDDAADAVAVAICHLNTNRQARVLAALEGRIP